MRTIVDPMTIVIERSNEIPIDVFSIIRDLGLGPNFKPLEDNVSGWIERMADGEYEITINAHHQLLRQRFTAAHELGHYIYHRDLLGNGVGDTRAYRAESSPFPNFSIRQVHETQANSFAANLLMPRKSIENLRSLGVTEVDELANRFQVSRHAMSIRLGLPQP